MASDPDPTHLNRLATATSPYLLQHKHNPVDWWPWGPEALAAAQQNNKPILLSVGYAACHWCHVMAHESFEDDTTARVMNELFVNIKVDREERPDIDQIYMQALHLLGEQGGWPLTMFLTPAGEPFWGGTYFPNTARYGRPAFTDVLREVSRVFHEEPASIEKNRAALLANLAQKARPAGKVVVGAQELNGFARQIGNMLDPVNGGLRGAPKFPQPSILEMLWRAGQRTGDMRFFQGFDHALERMSEGGIYDHLGGGYSRYSVDDRWLVPHFEKMLYDNAQLLELLALAYLRTGNVLFRYRAHETVGWLTREMTTKDGAFAASLDADSEGEEGKFYVWSKNDIIELIGPEAGEFFAAHYDVTDDGNFEGHNILNRLSRVDRSEADDERLKVLRQVLLDAREARVRPGLDDKVLADWNGLMIAALVNAGVAFDEPSWIDMAARAFDFIAAAMSKADRLGHSWREGQLLYPGLASDFAAMTRAALALYEARGDRRHLHQAQVWQAALDRYYADPDTGSYYLTADDAEGLLLRPHATADDAIPNHTAVTAQNLVRLAALTGDHAYREKADRLFDGILSAAGSNLFTHIALLNALDLRLHGAEIVVTGQGANSEALAQAALKQPFTGRILLRTGGADLPPSHPAQDKIKAAQISGADETAFICVGERCSLPVTAAADIAPAIAAMRG
ncbi:MAG: thioredoxin domain-containing protein [Pseudolabrys sp.]